MGTVRTDRRPGLHGAWVGPVGGLLFLGLSALAWAAGLPFAAILIAGLLLVCPLLMVGMHGNRRSDPRLPVAGSDEGGGR